MSSLNPNFIVNHQTRSVSRFEKLLLTLSEKKLRSLEDCDDILKEFKDLVRRLSLEFKEDCVKFACPSSAQRIDVFYRNILGNDERYPGKCFYLTAIHELSIYLISLIQL